jgi:hypothetical protein
VDNEVVQALFILYTFQHFFYLWMGDGQTVSGVEVDDLPLRKGTLKVLQASVILECHI